MGSRSPHRNDGRSAPPYLDEFVPWTQAGGQSGGELTIRRRQRLPAVPLISESRVRSIFPLRAVLSLVFAACASSPAGAPRAARPAETPLIVVSPTEPREQTADQQAQQVLNRL